MDYSKLQQIGGITDNLEDRVAIQDWLARKKLCKKGPAGPGGQQTEQKSAVCCCSDGIELDLEHSTYRERLKEFGLFNQETEGKGGFTCSLPHPNEWLTGETGSSQTHTVKRDNGNKLQQEILQLHIREKVLHDESG